MNASLEQHLRSRASELAEACTRCGKCVDVCPVVPYGAAAGSPSEHVVKDLVRFLVAEEPLSVASSAWLHACNGCGDCISACPASINPRQMLLLASIKESSVSPHVPQLFRRMSRAIRVMTAMQLVPQEFAKLFVPPAPRRVEAVFYVGCNALRTPHLLFNTMHVLDALEIDYEVVGGPSACCGTIHTKWQGDLSTGARLTTATLARFEGFKPQRVLNWCPSCQLHLGEAVQGYASTTFDFDHVTAYLTTHIERLRQKFVRPIARRVVLHAHRGYQQVGADVERLLGAIPGLQVVDTVYESSYTCGSAGCSKCPELQSKEHAQLLARLQETAADMLVTLYHGCHMMFAAEAKQGTFDVVNFTDLLAAALGVTAHQDTFKRWQALGDPRQVAREAQEYLKENGLDFDVAWIERQLVDLFTASEFSGGAGCAPYPKPPAALRGGT
jgi:Fe-S oxidoreductase